MSWFVNSPAMSTTAFPVFYAYVLKSIHHHYYYKGHCKDLQARLDQHNAGLTFSNKHYRPFQVVYFELFETEAEAIKREKYFKSAAGRRYLKKVLLL